MSLQIKFSRNQIKEVTGDAPSKEELSNINSMPLREVFQEYGSDILDALSSTQLKELMYELNIDTLGDFEADVEACAKALQEQTANNKRKREGDDSSRLNKKSKTADEYVPNEDEESEDDAEHPNTVPAVNPAENSDADAEEEEEEE